MAGEVPRWRELETYWRGRLFPAPPPPGVIGEMTSLGPWRQSGHVGDCSRPPVQIGHTYCIAARPLPISGEHAGDCRNSLYVTQLLSDLNVFAMVLNCFT